MSGLVVDTHAIIWFLVGMAGLSAPARTAIEAAMQAGDPIRVASITLAEMTYLVEKGRVLKASYDLVAQAVADPTSGFVLAPLDLATAEAVRRVPRALVPDMPDRIITATASALGLPLVTADRKIRAAGVATIW